MTTFLVVDDEKLSRASIIGIVEAMAIQPHIDQASNADEALALAVKRQYDFIITDIKMPEISGLDFIEAIRARNLSTRIIVMSGYSDYEFVRASFRYNVLDYLLKPVKPKELQELILHALSEEPQPRGKHDIEQEMARYIQENYSRDISLESMANHFNFNKKYFSSLIKSKLGEGFTEIITNTRIEKAKELLAKSNFSIKEIAFYVGYVDQQYFHRIFKKKVGLTPLEYRAAKQ